MSDANISSAKGASNRHVGSKRAYHIIEDIHAQGWCHQQPLLLPVLALGRDQPGAQDGQEGVERKVQVFDIVALIGLEHALQTLRTAHHYH